MVLALLQNIFIAQVNLLCLEIIGTLTLMAKHLLLGKKIKTLDLIRVFFYAGYEVKTSNADKPL